jgi:hypothetical protein
LKEPSFYRKNGRYFINIGERPSEFESKEYCEKDKKFTIVTGYKKIKI